MNENQWVKDSERKRNFHALVTMDADLIFRMVSNKWFFIDRKVCMKFLGLRKNYQEK
jgi:hypothetical protein